ncbi:MULTISPECIES: 5-carboxymethyl-2-hydroxymuconate Delta-isomerase [Rhizobium]|uniref:5-carboxymethyl-2-hydroxymuconate Delta-isomerase n=1 Tax=Rhizobium lentis TaxID=1138194 RepID=A0ABS7I9Y9_9HYPH|nr:MULTISPECIES: 5-carboxymethyl-2-hydroxymuconate Delta-isomerase [Rhizobium]MBX4922287.1 5-carboxymethyl-2-hydroxymuconate Delta-isomerase [Rhizobium bangladeshense]MBX5088294.1 5-carboxymethyl-2-hydroxymuconate Delta-isomerase [Rhizobium lentis]MBX5101206.1 5-carboxymethyl-2-hydroxymuconate Delta-isomerase [Rhizobium lentis]MBY3599244.1 5-carboxymethyl-2-hydroxymuconate Delta-isomerase [Rhizobium bangladeshense]
MPHLTMEYSANLDGRVDIAALCQALLKTVLETGLFEIGAVRVRALRADHYAIADELAENAFVDLNFRIGKGRTAEEKKRTGEGIFAAASEILAPLFETPHFALSLEIREIDAELSWKKNVIHPRLRGN